ncbi:MAG: hypothetical protein AVO33_06155 [delta proteobacterium ML8_F1]|nr:MAG: hypothetical protein AVO33_06155 [delta proteobacterium ML8_F1]
MRILKTKLKVGVKRLLRPLHLRFRRLMIRYGRRVNPCRTLESHRGPGVPLESLEGSQERVSVIIPTLNGGGEFAALLRGLREQKGIGYLEIIAVDSGSKDETLPICREFGVRVIEIPGESFTHSYARNLGAERATGKYLLFMTQDVALAEDYWLLRMIEGLKRLGAVAVSSVERPRQKADLYARLALCYHRLTWRTDGGDKILAMPRIPSPLSLRMNGQLSNVNCLVDRQVFMSHRFKGNFAEDLGLGISLIRGGHRLGILTSTHVVHSHNREGYYHMKRAFAETKALAVIFREFPREYVVKTQVVGEILEGYGFLLKLLGEIDEYPGSGSPGKFFAFVDRRMGRWRDKRVGWPQTHSLEEPRVREVVQRLSALVVHLPAGWPRGYLIDALAGYFQGVVGTYVIASYREMDEALKEQIAGAVYRQYCGIMGVELGKCGVLVPWDPDLKEIFSELAAGV